MREGEIEKVSVSPLLLWCRSYHTSSDRNEGRNAKGKTMTTTTQDQIRFEVYFAGTGWMVPASAEESYATLILAILTMAKWDGRENCRVVISTGTSCISMCRDGTWM